MPGTPLPTYGECVYPKSAHKMGGQSSVNLIWRTLVIFWWVLWKVSRNVAGSARTWGAFCECVHLSKDVVFIISSRAEVTGKYLQFDTSSECNTSKPMHTMCARVRCSGVCVCILNATGMRWRLKYSVSSASLSSCLILMHQKCRVKYLAACALVMKCFSLNASHLFTPPTTFSLQTRHHTLSNTCHHASPVAM